MIEQKLNRTAEAMSTPRTAFSAIEADARIRRRTFRPGKAVIVVLTLLFLVGCGATVTNYHHYSAFDWGVLFFDPRGYFEPDIDDAQKAAEKLGVEIPETLGGTECWQVVTINTSSQDSWVLSWLFHEYESFNVFYGNEQKVKEGDKTYNFATESVTLVFGTTENELWRELFHFDENGNWTRKNLVEQETMEYRGRTLHLGTTAYDYTYEGVKTTYTDYFITWVDEEHDVAFRLGTTLTDFREEYSMTGVSEETLLEYAKQIIDMNS